MESVPLPTVIFLSAEMWKACPDLPKYVGASLLLQCLNTQHQQVGVQTKQMKATPEYNQAMKWKRILRGKLLSSSYIDKQ